MTNHETSDEPETQLYAVLYTENHPTSPELTFLGVFSSVEKAQESIVKHMAEERLRFPDARIDEYDYQTFSGELDRGGSAWW